MTAITITLEKTLKWRDNWSQGDIRIIKEDLASLGAVSYRTVGKQYVACRNADGRVVASIHPGYIEFPKKFVPAGLNGRTRWRTLSTFKPRDESTSGPLRSNKRCSLCLLQLPLTGVCDCAD